MLSSVHCRVSAELVERVYRAEAYHGVDYCADKGQHEETDAVWPLARRGVPPFFHGIRLLFGQEVGHASLRVLEALGVEARTQWLARRIALGEGSSRETEGLAELRHGGQTQTRAQTRYKVARLADDHTGGERGGRRRRIGL
jgi:hypothetical protein